MGPPGIGKTHTIMDKFTKCGGTVYEKAQNKWFDGYANERAILLDDLDLKTDHAQGLGHYIKRWADKWKC